MNTNYKFAVERIISSYITKSNTKSIKYIVLYQTIKKCILKAELLNNWLMPPTRILAEEMNLSRTTVVKAYELLALEKLIIPKHGSGYHVNFVKDKDEEKKINTDEKFDLSLFPKISEKGQFFLSNIGLINREKNKGIAFRPGLPPLDIFPVNQWKKLLNTYWRQVKASSLSNSPTSGLNSLKHNICNYLNVSRNVKCITDQLIIVSGSLQSLYLISSALINKGDSIVVEDPTFPNVHSIFKSTQANIIPVKLDDEGININLVNKQNHHKPKLIHVTPSNHYPLGIKTTLKRRQQILKWASDNKALIVENDYENEVNNIQVPTIFSLDKEDRTIYLGTFNRLLHPTIRLGYMIVPKYLIPAMEAIQEHSHKFVAPSTQMVMSQFIEKNHLYEHLKNVNEVANERYDFFLKYFQNEITQMSIENKDYSSLHLITKFNEKISVNDEIKIIHALLDTDIVTHSLNRCYISSEKQNGLIFGYSAIRPNAIKSKIDKIKLIIDKHLI